MATKLSVLIAAYLSLNAAAQATVSSTSSETNPSSAAAFTATGTNGVSPSQYSAFSVAMKDYLTSLEQSPEVSHIAVDIYIQDSNAAAALESNPAQLLPIDVTATTIDLRSIATAPPLSFSSLSIYSDLDPWLVSSIQSLQTSAALEIARIDQAILHTSASLPNPTSSSSSGGAARLAIAKPTGVAAMGAAVGALGAAVALL